MLQGVKWVAPLQSPELLAQWHIAEDMNATAVRTWNLARISKSQMSNVSFFHSALLASLTIRPPYPGWRHLLPFDLGVLGRPSEGVDVSNRKFLL